MNTTIEFKENDQKYIDWLLQNPNGYVVNTRRAIDTEYMVLHKATCSFISTYPKTSPSLGGFTEKKYIKICAASIKSLSLWVENNGRKDGSFSKECSSCHPSDI